MMIDSSAPSRLWKGSGGTLRLAFPLILAQMGVVGMGLIDTINFSVAGTLSLAGGSLGTAVFSLVHIIAVGVLAAVGNKIAFSKGAKNLTDVSATLAAGIQLSIAFGMVMAGLSIMFGFLLPLAGQDHVASKLSIYYLIPVSVSIIPSLLFTTYRGLLVSFLVPAAITRVTLEGLILKIALSVILIKQNVMPVSDSPAQFVLSISGFSTTVAYIFMAIRIRHVCRTILPEYCISPPKTSAKYTNIADILRLGTPIGLVYGVEAGFFTATILVAGVFGPQVLAAHHIANQCVYITFMVAVGLSHVASAKVGAAAGATDYREVQRLSTQSLLLGLILMTTTALLFLLFGPHLAGIFVDLEDESRTEIIALASTFLFAAALIQWADGSQNIAMGILRGLKDSKVTVYICIVGYWLIGLPAAYVLSSIPSIGPVGIWLGIGIGLYATAGLLILRVRSYIIKNQKQNHYIGPITVCKP